MCVRTLPSLLVLIIVRFRFLVFKEYVVCIVSYYVGVILNGDQRTTLSIANNNNNFRAATCDLFAPSVVSN